MAVLLRSRLLGRFLVRECSSKIPTKLSIYRSNTCVKTLLKLNPLLKGETTFPLALVMCFQLADKSFAYKTVFFMFHPKRPNEFHRNPLPI